MRRVMVRVLPVPAPASTHTGPRGAETAARCSSSSPRTGSSAGGSSWNAVSRAAVGPVLAVELVLVTAPMVAPRTDTASRLSTGAVDRAMLLPAGRCPPTGGPAGVDHADRGEERGPTTG